MQRRTLAWKIRKGMTAAGVVLGLALGGKGILAVTGPISRQEAKTLANVLGQHAIQGIWNLSHPLEAIQESLGDEKGQWPDPDPSYRQYQKLRSFYESHPYLARHDSDESGGGQGKQDSPADQTGNEGESALAAIDQKSTGSFSASLPALTGTTSRPITGKTYVIEQLADYDFLMKNFYNVHTSTTAGRVLMNAEKLLEKDLTINKDGEGPQILIYHTHSQEGFADSGAGETVVAVGERLTELLEARGYEVYHDESVYDLVNGKLDRSKAYTYAGEGIETILEQHPSIQVILDIHRDGVADNLHLAAKVDGKSTAQIMFFNGLSQTPDGPVEYLENPYREDNLAFSLQMQLNAQAYFPGFTRKIYLKGLRYNLHLRPRSALIEVGAQTNTFEEALNAMEPLAELLDMVLQGG